MIPRQGPEIRFVRVSDGQDLFEFCHEFPDRSFDQRTRKGQVSRPFAEIGREIYSSRRTKERVVNESIEVSLKNRETCVE